MTQRIVSFASCVHCRCDSASGTTLLEAVTRHFGHWLHSVRDMVSFMESQGGCVQRGIQLRFGREAGRGLETHLLVF